jgi:hypothetical protein
MLPLYFASPRNKKQFSDRHRFDRAGKFRKDGISNGTEDPPAGLGKEVVGDDR